MSDTTNLILPYLAPGQAQKHVTVNETLRRLDAIVQMAVVSMTTTAEPGSPADGAVYILPSGKTGAHWGGYANHSIGYYRDGAWEQITPREGWLAFVKDDDLFVYFDGSEWSELPGGEGGGSYTDEMAQDAAAALFTPDDGDIDFTYNDATPSIGAQIKAGAVGAAELASGAVETAKIANDAVDFTKLLDATAAGFIGATASGAYSHRTPTQVTAALDALAGDSGSGGTKGLAPAPSSGDGAARKALLASGAWGNVPEVLVIAVTDETTTITAGAGKFTFRMPFAMTLTGVRASLKTASTTGGPFTVDINEGGASILSTKLTIDDTEKTSTTAAAAAVISDASLADDAEITIDVDDEGSGAAGLKVTLSGYRP